MNLECTIKRNPSGLAATIGAWYIEGAWECHTLEDVVRADPNPSTPANEAKVPGETAIPAGRYEIGLTWSPRFKRILPELLNVPGFSGVRVHPGNTDRDTEGCILVGRELGPAESILQSRAAFDVLFAKLSAAAVKGARLWVTIE